MQYEIKGTPLPVVICTLNPGETIVTERGAMSWMSANMVMETKTGGIGKVFSRAISGESIFLNRYTPQGGAGMLAMASSFPGTILPVDVSRQPIIAQKSAFLGAEQTVELSIAFQRKLGSGFFGGEGFIMQRLSGCGYAFLEIDGSVIEYELRPGETLILDTGYLAAMESSVTMDIETVKGLGNMLFGGEGIFNTKVTGPGHVWVQTMPVSHLASSILPYLPKTRN